MATKPVVSHMRVPFAYDADAVSLENGLVCPEDSLAEQGEAEDADINVLMKRFGVTGHMPARGSLPLVTNGDFVPAMTFQESMDKIVKAREAFMELPADVRARFDHDPGKFVDYCTPSGDEKVDKRRLEDLREWGLAVPEKPPAVEPPPMRVQVVNQGEEPPKPAK